MLKAMKRKKLRQKKEKHNSITKESKREMKSQKRETLLVKKIIPQ